MTFTIVLSYEAEQVLFWLLFILIVAPVLYYALKTGIEIGKRINNDDNDDEDGGIPAGTWAID